MYIIQYSIGQYDCYQEINIFVTNDISVAKKYVEKFKMKLAKWKKDYEKYQDKDGYLTKKHVKKINRWMFINEFNKCWYKVIDER